MTVKATREGMQGDKTASGYLVDTIVPFVALPSTAALRQWVTVTNPLTGKSIRALVLASASDAQLGRLDRCALRKV